jgi:hypothetical protein
MFAFAARLQADELLQQRANNNVRKRKNNSKVKETASSDQSTIINMESVCADYACGLIRSARMNPPAATRGAVGTYPIIENNVIIDAA